jgi:selenocysteine lyase/cysteine desulfurase
MTALEGAPGIRFFTSFDPAWSCAIGTLALEGYSSNELARTLFDNWKIHVATANKEQIDGIRVTPGISSTEADIDGFIAAMLELSASDRRR